MSGGTGALGFLLWKRRLRAKAQQKRRRASSTKTPAEIERFRGGATRLANNMLTDNNSSDYSSRCALVTVVQWKCIYTRQKSNGESQRNWGGIMHGGEKEKSANLCGAIALYIRMGKACPPNYIIRYKNSSHRTLDARSFFISWASRRSKPRRR